MSWWEWWAGVSDAVWQWSGRLQDWQRVLVLVALVACAVLYCKYVIPPRSPRNRDH